MKNIDKAHEINRILMRKLHSICKEYNITYYYDSGSLIGAIRHKSFIPWDDDVDVAFTREEYKKLLEVPAEAWGDDFRLVPPHKLAKGTFLDFTTRLIYLKDTVPLKSYDKAMSGMKEEYAGKICIDCFILDSAPNSRFGQIMKVVKHNIIYGEAMGHRSYIDYSEYGLPQKIVIGILSTIGKHKSLKNIYKKQMKLCTECNKKNTDYYYYSTYPITLVGIMLKKEWFRSTVPVQVDEDYFDAPVDYDAVLKAQYGDYMQLPPEEKRVPQHVLPDEE